MDLGDVANGVRDLFENVVVERVAAYEVAEVGEGRQLFLDGGFEIKHVVGVQRAKYVRDVLYELLTR